MEIEEAIEKIKPLSKSNIIGENQSAALKTLLDLTERYVAMEVRMPEEIPCKSDTPIETVRLFIATYLMPSLYAHFTGWNARNAIDRAISEAEKKFEAGEVNEKPKV